MGSMVDAVTKATIALESVSVVITQPAATAWIRPPRLESKVADHSARNIGLLKGASAPLGEVPVSDCEGSVLLDIVFH